MNKKLLDILVCPRCKGDLQYDKKNQTLVCSIDQWAFPIVDDIPVLLESEAQKIEQKIV